MSRLKVHEIFFSLQGETTYVGLPTLFIRLTGCPLRCTYCDSEYAFTGGQWQAMESLVAYAKQESIGRVCVTGGEPLAQPACYELLHKLCEAGLKVTLETSGAYPIEKVDQRVVCILDLKTPGSGEVSRNLWDNLDHLKPVDEIKCVVTDELDYQWVKQMLVERKLIDSHHEILLSPSYGQLAEKDLAEWVLADRLPVRVQLQMHKYIWGDIPGK